MKGFVDRHGHAFIMIHLRASDVATPHGIQVWIDTGFNGEYPLLGVGLLVGLDLHISYRTGEITIE